MAKKQKGPKRNSNCQQGLSWCGPAFTLVEVIVVMGLIGFLIASILTFVNISNRSWGVGQDKLVEQQQARIAMNEIHRLLRQTCPEWYVNNVSYPITTPNGTRIDFYVPVFGGANDTNITALQKVTFKRDDDDSTLLCKKVGVGAPKVVATHINALSFGCACAGCTGINTDCPVVAVNITTQKQDVYTLQTKVKLRNTETDLPDTTLVEETEEWL